MIKSWYSHVREETMAPARMVAFMEKHAKTCEVCINDPELKEEIAKITELILPESKIPKAIRQQTLKDKEDEEDDIEDDDVVDDDDDDVDDDTEDDTDDEDDDEDDDIIDDEDDLDIDLEIDDDD